jgi:hypothetical protein
MGAGEPQQHAPRSRAGVCFAHTWHGGEAALEAARAGLVAEEAHDLEAEAAFAVALRFVPHLDGRGAGRLVAAARGEAAERRGPLVRQPIHVGDVGKVCASGPNPQLGSLVIVVVVVEESGLPMSGSSFG